ncbi:BSD domain-containing protein [Aspergillus candidus]|uniref:BSD domain-containing protein n=1 Tax=Aspergillus candidus TaxID=41067 RepID=A0A2I2FL57_ASPCN|nr:hypothetical protein BDW47DRAFT_99949 [Aspergillus candidus]PLB41334.1 hypothetical protein BDW47DRAFT_99949 [Aspergillus candidus]
MDLAYDHIEGEIFAASQRAKKEDNKESGATQEGDSNNAAAADHPPVDLNTELQETFRAFSASPWGVRIGGLWDNVRKQGESYYEGARQEYAAASEEAVKGFSDLRENIVGRTRGLSLSTAFAGGEDAEGSSSGAAKDEASTPTGTGAEGEGSASGEGFLARLKAEAARRLKEIEKAEEAADEAILRFGMNIGQKLRDAVSIVPPDSEADKLLFESKDADGKRVIHATRFEAQLHVIHSNLESFTKDPVSDEWAAFKEKFDIDSKTDDVAADLEKYPELRSAMEKLVPEQVEYATFWCRYYFLRLVIETEEQKRKELLKGANAGDEEEVAWDDDSDDDTDSPSTPQVKTNKPTDDVQADAAPAAEKSTPKSNERRPSNDQQSSADSESSYDLVSGTTSRTPASPKEKAKDDESDDDWE